MVRDKSQEILNKRNGKPRVCPDCERSLILCQCKNQKPPTVLPDVPGDLLAPKNEREKALKITYERQDIFDSGFAKWLEDNWKIYKAFEEIALRATGYHKNFGAMAIVNYLRWQTMYSESAKENYKIQNGIQPDLARLFMILNPKHNGFFRLRFRASNVIEPEQVIDAAS
jgi:uncharacterized protein YbaR (Trm112 family)